MARHHSATSKPFLFAVPLPVDSRIESAGILFPDIINLKIIQNEKDYESGKVR